MQRDVVMQRNRSVRFSRLPSHVFLAGIALLSILLGTTDAYVQARGQLRDNAGESNFIEALRQDDPAAAERYVTLRDARDRRLLSTYQEQTNRINKALEERARTRDDLQRMLRGD